MKIVTEFYCNGAEEGRTRIPCACGRDAKFEVYTEDMPPGNHETGKGFAPPLQVCEECLHNPALFEFKG